jgi:hypothetical protein
MKKIEWEELNAKEFKEFAFIQDLIEAGENCKVQINEFDYDVLKVCENFLLLNETKRLYIMKPYYHHQYHIKITLYGDYGEEYTVPIIKVATKYGIYNFY